MRTASSPPWYRNRRYLHFDSPVGLKRAERLVTDPNAVARHAFYPLISFEITSKKLAKAPNSHKLVAKGKIRPISYAAHLDSHIYRYYAHLLSVRYEAFLTKNGLTDSILAFRQLGKNNINFAADAFAEIRRRGNCAAVALDISGFFDNLDHELLKQSWCSLLGVTRLPQDHFSVLRSITKYSRVDRSKLYRALNISAHNPRSGRYRVCTALQFRDVVRRQGLITPHLATSGIPQGTPISAILSNVYMMRFDLSMRQLMHRVGGVYYRYCDDILLIVPHQHRDSIAGEAQQQINQLKLSIHPSKTERRTFKKYSHGIQEADKPLQYLGFTFDGQRILIRSAAFARYSQRMKKGVRLAKATMRSRNRKKGARGAAVKALYKRKLYERYSHFGHQNFLRYGYRAAEIMKSNAIRDQLKPLWGRLNDEIQKS